MNLIYTIVLWILVFLIYISGRNNKTNIWGAVSAGIFSIGAFKEYFFFELVPKLKMFQGNIAALNAYTYIYSDMTAVLYYLAMPSAVIFSLYFYGLDIKNSKIFKTLKYIVFIPSIFMSIIYLPPYTRYYQLNSKIFWVAVSAYNLIYGMIFIAFIFMGVLSEVNAKTRSQKLIAAVIIIPPVLYWYITIFVIHTLGISKYFKIWQGNLIIVLFCISLYIIMAFKSGVMGLRLKRENYQWNSDMSIIYKGVEFTSHMMKNQAAKMEWCIENLKKQYKSIDEYSELPEEFSILSRSIYDMKEFIRKAKMYSGSIYIREEQCSLKEIIKESTVIPVETAGEITIGSNIQDDVFVNCDKVHMSETLSNIILNSVESISQAGKINIDGAFDKRKAYYLLTVTDNGMGMTRENIKNIFMPYYTTKNSEKNFGLGLTYCLNVIKKHGGYIKVKSKLGIGTTVIIAIPARRVSYIKMEDMPLCQIE